MSCRWHTHSRTPGHLEVTGWHCNLWINKSIAAADLAISISRRTKTPRTAKKTTDFDRDWKDRYERREISRKIKPSTITRTCSWKADGRGSFPSFFFLWWSNETVLFFSFTISLTLSLFVAAAHNVRNIAQPPLINPLRAATSLAVFFAVLEKLSKQIHSQP